MVSGKEYVDVLKDLSFEGAFIETANKFEAGQVVQIEIPMSTSPKIIRTTGVVTRITKEGIGIKLIKDKKFDYKA